jgi:predicted PurR-regulated permease PerM
MTQDRFQRTFLLILCGAITLLFFQVVKPFLVPLLLGAIFSNLARPLFDRFVRWTKGRRNTAAFLTLTTVVVAVVLPCLALLGVIANQAVQVSYAVGPRVQTFFQHSSNWNDLFQRIPGLHFLTPYQDLIFSKVGALVAALGEFIFARLSSLTTGTVVFIFHLAIMGYAMYFFLLDGPAMLTRWMGYLPLKAEDKERLIKSYLSAARATVKGTVVIGLVQGVGAGLALGLAGIPNVLFWSMVMAALSMVPSVGTALVWVPACAYLMLTGHVTAGILVAVWCAGVVGSADNVLRPLLIGKDTEISQLMVLISTLGGLLFFGLPGVIFGPVVGLLFVTCWDIYGVLFREQLKA